MKYSRLKDKLKNYEMHPLQFTKKIDGTEVIHVNVRASDEFDSIEDDFEVDIDQLVRGLSNRIARKADDLAEHFDAVQPAMQTRSSAISEFRCKLIQWYSKHESQEALNTLVNAFENIDIEEVEQ